MNLKKTFIFLIATSILASGLISCGGGNNSSNETSNADSTATDSVSEETITEDTLSYMLPSPLQIAFIFKKSGLKYVAGTTFDVKKQNDFATSFKQSLALGVYSSDLAYCVLNKEKQDAINYMNAVKALSDKLGMSTVFDSESLLKRFETNISIEDSIMLILSEIQSKSDEFFSSNDRQMNAAIVFSGAWVESMYIAGKVSSKEKASKLPSQLADQLGILQNLLKELKRHESKDAGIPSLITNLTVVHDQITAIPGVKEMMESENPSEVKVTPTDVQLKELVSKIESLRAEMTAK